MQINFIHAEDEFQHLEAQWNSLLEQSITDVPFLRHEFQLPWWGSLGGGEWNNGELWIAAGADSMGDLLGLAPFFKWIPKQGPPHLMFIGSTEISDYLDLIVTKENLPVFVKTLFQELDKLPRTVWELIDLQNIPAWSPSSNVIREQASALGWKVEQVKMQACPIVFFKGDWDTYLTQLKKKQRHELRRKMRRVEANGETISLRILSTRGELGKGIDDFLDLMAHDEKKSIFLTASMRSYLREMITGAFDNGWLHLAFLEINSVPMAGYLNFDYRNRLWVYNSGINPDYYNLSPGWVLLGYIIQGAIKNNREGIDFLRGDEAYKYRLGAEDRFIHRLILTR